MIKSAFFFLFITGAFFLSYSQQPYISKGIRDAISGNCIICNSNAKDSGRFVRRSDSFNKAQTAYHNCHLFFFTNQSDSAYKYSLLTVSAFKNKTDSDRIVLAKYIKARILARKQLYNEALKEYLNLSNLDKVNKEVKSDIYAVIGAIYIIQKDYNQSIEYLSYCLNKYTTQDSFALKNIYSNIALCHLAKQSIKEAEFFFQKSISISEQLKDTVGLAKSYTNIANQYYNNYQDALAIEYFKKALSLALLTNDYRLKQDAYLNMAVVSENKKDYKSSLAFRKAYEENHDSIYGRDNIWGIAAIKNKLDSQESAHKVEIAQQTNKLQALRLDEQRQQLYIALLASAAFLSFFFFAFYAYRQKNKQNIVINAQREELDALNHTKDQLFSIVAHDLRSPVQTMKVTLNKLRTALSHNNIGQAEQVSGEIETISNSTYALLNNLLYWALSQTGQLHFVKDKLHVTRLVEQVLYDYVPVAAAKNIVLENCVPESLYCSGDMNTVKIIIRNLVDNAIKFSEPFTPVAISGSEKNGECIISVTDGGKGVDDTIIQALANKNTKRVENSRQPSQSTGIGLWLAKTMAERNGGSLQIERRTKGTKMNIRLPKYESDE